MNKQPTRVVALSANTRRPSRTRSLVNAIALRLADSNSVQVLLYDFVDIGIEFGMATSLDELSANARSIFDQVSQADALIVGTPVYKGAYSGHFKHFFDLLSPECLIHKPVCLVANGGGSKHALVVEHSLRPLFGFFSAATTPTAVYGCEADFLNGEPVDEALISRIDRAVYELRTVCNLTAVSKMVV